MVLFFVGAMIAGISRAQYIEQHNSNEDVWHRMNMPVPVSDTIYCHRLRWLGRMCDNHLPKQMLFGWLPQSRLPHGVKLRWRDRARKDLKHFHICEGDWRSVDSFVCSIPFIIRTSAAAVIL